MDDIKILLTTTDGRISRKQWWLGVLVLVVISLVVSIVLGILLGANPTLMAWVAVLINIALIWPSYAIGIKRRHDRASDGMDLKVLIAVSVIINIIQALGIGVSMTEIGGVAVPMPAIWLSIINLAFAIFAIYMLVQLGFLKGTTGANAYGLDPVDGAA